MTGHLFRPSRRALLGAAAVLPLAAVPGAAATAEPNQDAELILACEQYIKWSRAYEDCDEDGDGPIWDAFMHFDEVVGRLEPRTMNGLLALARATMRGAENPNGDEMWEEGAASEWAPRVVKGLLRLAGMPA